MATGTEKVVVEEVAPQEGAPVLPGAEEAAPPDTTQTAAASSTAPPFEMYQTPMPQIVPPPPTA